MINVKIQDIMEGLLCMISNSTLKDEMITFEDSAKYLIENHITTQEECSLLEGI